jgi:hypothetical protein
MRFLSLALTATFSGVVTASLQVVPGGTWTTVSLLHSDESPLKTKSVKVLTLNL